MLYYHDVAPEDRERFASQLRWLGRTWNFVTPERFAAMVAGQEPIRGSHLLLTFDDGFASQRAVAEQVLNPMRIRALFFAMSDLVAIEDRMEARRFMAELYPAARTGALPEHWSNMGWADLEALLEQGHTVGAHTCTHPRLSRLESIEGLEKEIVASGDALERRLGVPIEHFAWTYGDLASISQTALAVARRRYRFVHSGLRGDNAANVSPGALRRYAASAQDPRAVLGALLEGATDFRDARARAQLDAWNLLVP